VLKLFTVEDSSSPYSLFFLQFRLSSQHFVNNNRRQLFHNLGRFRASVILSDNHKMSVSSIRQFYSTLTILFGLPCVLCALSLLSKIRTACSYCLMQSSTHTAHALRKFKAS
jgi:hypothetical protein